MGQRSYVYAFAEMVRHALVTSRLLAPIRSTQEQQCCHVNFQTKAGTGNENKTQSALKLAFSVQVCSGIPAADCVSPPAGMQDHASKAR